MDNRDQSASSEESAKLGLDDLDLPELSVESPTPEVDNSLKQSEIELEINNKQTTPVQEQSKSVSEEKLPAKTLTNQTKAASPNCSDFHKETLVSFTVSHKFRNKN